MWSNDDYFLRRLVARASVPLRDATALSRVPAKKIRNDVARELVHLVPTGKPDNFWSMKNLVEHKVIYRVGNGGSLHQVAKLVAAVAAFRMAQRLSERSLGTTKDSLVMIYDVAGENKREGGFVTAASVSPSFCTKKEISLDIFRRLEAGANEVRVLPVDAIIEELVADLKKAGGKVV